MKMFSIYSCGYRKKECGENVIFFIKERAFKDEHYSVRGGALQELANGWRNEPEVLQFVRDRCVHDEGNIVRGNAVSLLASLWPDEPGTFEMIMDKAVSDEHYSVRKTAMEELAKRKSAMLYK